MDLKEETAIGGDPSNHWYYISKGRAIKSLLGDAAFDSVLDVGAGSGVFSRMLIDAGICQHAICVDPNYADDWIENNQSPQIQYLRRVGDSVAPLVVMLDVIEHVDDAKALAELFRILRPGGFAVLTTPVIEGWDETYENPAITTRKGRILHFGQGDHTRFYGRDFRDRMIGAGFQLEEYTAVEPFVSAHALERGGKLFIGRKP